MDDDLHFMRMAIDQAQLAHDAGEIPVGAVVVKDGRVLGAGRNAPIGTRDPSAHAEIMALRAAAAVLGNYRLDGCDLYVTLEPCAMCAGAMLHARVRRVVFGAADPKTGAAGSVLNLFGNAGLNHQTHVRGGVLAPYCASLLHDFFVAKRAKKALSAVPLRDDALRTPDRRFDGLPDYPWAPHYVTDLPSLGGLRMHYLDEGGSASKGSILCLHGYPTWSFLFRKMVPGLLAAGYRVVVPDLVGFGKSDKPKKPGFHTFAFHRDTLLELIQGLDLHNVIALGQGEGSFLAAAMAQALPDRVRSAVLLRSPYVAMPTRASSALHAGAVVAAQVPHLSDAEYAGYQAPFVDAGYCAALKALQSTAKHDWLVMLEHAVALPFLHLSSTTSAEVGDFLPEAGEEAVQKLLAHLKA